MGEIKRDEHGRFAAEGDEAEGRHSASTDFAGRAESTEHNQSESTEHNGFDSESQHASSPSSKGSDRDSSFDAPIHVAEVKPHPMNLLSWVKSKVGKRRG